MDDIAASVVDNPPLPQESTTPHAEGSHGVGEGEPQRHEHHPRTEAHPTEHSTRQHDECERGEEELEDNHVGHPKLAICGSCLQGAILVVMRGGWQHSL